jgi:hypothetical protein
MLYSAVGLAVLGAAVGLVFRWKVLLPFIIVLPFLTVPLSVSRGLNYGHVVIVVIAAEAALQGGYFIGLLTRFIGVRSAAFFKRRRDPRPLNSDHNVTPPSGVAKRP